MSFTFLIIILSYPKEKHKLFADCYRSKIYTALKDAAENLDTSPNYMSVPAALKELEKIEMVYQSDGVYRLDHSITKTQKVILSAFHLDETDVKTRAKTIRDRMQNSCNV